jgi:chitin disaccharide deacetylase
MSKRELRRIWLCADGYGISPAVSTAIRDMQPRVMVVTPSFWASEANALGEAATTRAAISLCQYVGSAKSTRVSLGLILYR